MTKVNPPINELHTYYLPHHAVIKPDSTTTKLRVVFNASSPSSNGTSLNDILYPGPVLQADLTILILRWRLFRYVYNADIEKMYRQILVNPAHTPYQRIIYRSSPEETLNDFELNTVTFGVSCAPYLAIRTLHQIAQECESEYPHVSDILQNYMYVDDVLAGAHTLSTAQKSRDDLITVLQLAGFSLRKWTANNEYLLKHLPTDHLLDEEFIKLSNSSLAKTLGLRWNAGCDYFYFKLKNAPDKRHITKRSVLSEIAKLFDPAGWLSPKIITAKIIMQQIWIDNTGWDEELLSSTLQQWFNFVNDYQHIELEYQQLSAGQPISRKSHILPLNPVIDSEGIIRVNGRLSNSPTLNYKRTRWKYPQRDFEINDLVIVKQENLPPNQWRLGRILKVYPGSDKRVRVVDVRTSNGIITRPITKLVLLPLSSIQ